jgi:hypothetical protein
VPTPHYCNVIEAPWLVNGGHGASLNRHHSVACTERRGAHENDGGTGARGDHGTGKIHKRREISVVLMMNDPMISTRTRMQRST